MTLLRRRADGACSSMRNANENSVKDDGEKTYQARAGCATASERPRQEEIWPWKAGASLDLTDDVQFGHMINAGAR
eukprot:2166366-Pleurochrysis_carterae.AAC.4